MNLKKEISNNNKNGKYYETGSFSFPKEHRV